ncbi:MAG: hypothetical protein MJ156_00420 [Alphaproteobacteria bacterium]|nr:hypothetical protein [Alphaproteobacteria bacterium]
MQMYKLINGNLVEAPVFFRGIMGYNVNIEEMSKDGYKPVIEVGEGEAFRYNERKDHIEKIYYTPEFDYREARRKAYPEIGDMIDAICKAYDGEPEELQELMAQRALVKSTIKKTK